MQINTGRGGMNLLGHRIHCIDWGYGRLLFPWFGGWVCYREANTGGGEFMRDVGKRRSLRFARRGHFHNCTVTGVY